MIRPESYKLQGDLGFDAAVVDYLAPDYLCHKFLTRCEINNRVTWQSKQLYINLFVGLLKLRNLFLYWASTIWNNLDDSLKSRITVQNFKHGKENPPGFRPIT
jgi:hypothetical protein